jgi:hypothetical protein
MQSRYHEYIMHMPLISFPQILWGRQNSSSWTLFCESDDEGVLVFQCMNQIHCLNQMYLV